MVLSLSVMSPSPVPVHARYLLWTIAVWRAGSIGRAGVATCQENAIKGSDLKPDLTWPGGAQRLASFPLRERATQPCLSRAVFVRRRSYYRESRQRASAPLVLCANGHAEASRE